MPSLPPAEQHLELQPQGRYILPEALRYAGLGHERATGIFHIHFELPDEARLDIPLSAEVLAELVQDLVPLAGTDAKDLGEALRYIRRRQGMTNPSEQQE